MADTQASESFVQEVRRSLHHLHDPNELRSSPLIEALGLSHEEYPPSALRRLLSEAMDQLKPSDGPLQTRAWRTYQVLYYRFGEQSTQHEVATDLGLSIRHLRRTETLAVQELADYLWGHYRLASRWHEQKATRPGATVISSPGEAQTPSQEQELEWLYASMPSTPIAAAEVAVAAVHLVSPLANTRRVRVECLIPDDLPRLAVQFTALRHAIVSLLSTAVLHSLDGQIAITAALHGWTVHVTIVANMTDAAADLEAQDSERLHTARQLVELCGGSLDTHFDITHRRFVARLSLPAAEHVPVLIIDDNADTLRLLQRYLVNSRYRFAGTTDPHQALTLAQETHPQIIVLDVMLPDVDGWELLGRLHEHPQIHTVPIIVCSILPEEQLASALGAAAFLRKPITRQALLRALDHQLGLVSSESP